MPLPYLIGPAAGGLARFSIVLPAESQRVVVGS